MNGRDDIVPIPCGVADRISIEGIVTDDDMLALVNFSLNRNVNFLFFDLSMRAQNYGVQLGLPGAPFVPDGI